MIPSIIVRRLENETDEQFTARRDACRNEAARQGFSTPEKFGSNIFDENTFEEGVLDNIKQWPLVMVYDFGDLADTRDELAERITLIQGSGSNVMSVSEKIDLRGVDAEGAAAARAFGIWMGLAGTAPVELPSRVAPVAATAPTVPGWSSVEENIVREYHRDFGADKPAELGKMLGKHWMTAKSWLAYAAANPLPGPDGPDGE